jgi:hypothetical protein
MSAAAGTHPFAISTNGIMTDIDTTSPAGTLPPNDGGPGYNYSLAGTRMHVTRAYRPPPWEAHPSQRPSHDRDMAMLTRATWEHRARLLREGPWTPFPQNDCTFFFGPDRRPLPVGALITLWDRWDAMTGDCPECGGAALGISFGGGLSVGGIRGCCPRCARSTRRMVEGLARIRGCIPAALRGTPYVVHQGLHGRGGPARPLVALLRSFGAEELPSEAWVRTWEGAWPGAAGAAPPAGT